MTDRWKKVYVKEPGRTGTLLLVFVGVRFHLVSLEGRRISHVVTEIVFQCGNHVESHKLDPITSQNIVIPGKTKAKDNSKSMAYLANFLRSLSMKLVSLPTGSGCLFMFATSAAARAFIKWAEALQMLPELCKYVSYVGFNRKTAENRKFLRDFPDENSVVETSLVLGTKMLEIFKKAIARKFKDRYLSSCFSTTGIEKRFQEVWGNPGKVAFVDLRFVSGPPGGDPVIIQIGLSIQNGQPDHDQLFCCLPTETTSTPTSSDAQTLTSGQATFAPSEADMLGEFISFLAASHTSVVICTASDYFALSLLVSKVFRHGLESAFLDVVVGHFDLVAAASEAFPPAELGRATRCGIANPVSVWEAVFPGTEVPWGNPQSSPPAHVSARNLGKMVKATVPALTAFTRRRAKAMDELKLGEGDAAIELKVKLASREIRPRQMIQLMVQLSPQQESAIKVRQCVVFVPHGRKGQLALTDFKVCESTGPSNAISFLATNSTDDTITLAEDELLGFVR